MLDELVPDAPGRLTSLRRLLASRAGLDDHAD
jgi:ribosome biogenesis GTPase